jgi:hypothetical protein
MIRSCHADSSAGVVADDRERPTSLAAGGQERVYTGCRGGALDDLGLGGLKRGLDLAGQLGGHFRWLLYGHLIDQILWDAAKNLGAAKAIEAGNDEPPASKSGL